MENGERNTSTFEELCCRPFPVPDLRAGDTAVQLDELNMVDLIGPQSSRGWAPAQNHQSSGSACKICDPEVARVLPHTGS